MALPAWAGHSHVETVRITMQAYALHEDGDERGAKEYRFKAVAIDWQRGTAARYIAKTWLTPPIMATGAATLN
jgi:hypothetical protein